MNFLAQIFSGIGSGVLGQDLSQITDTAELAYFVIAGELLLVVLLLGAILWGIAVAK